MTMQRRDFLKASAAAAAVAAVAPIMPARAEGDYAFAPRPGAWRRFEVTTRLEIAHPEGISRAWVPLPSLNEPDWLRPMGSLWSSNGNAVMRHDAKYGADFLYVEWEKGTAAPAVEVISRIGTRDRAVDLAKPRKAASLGSAARRFYTEPSALIPTDGIVKATADKITAGAQSDVEKAHRIYEWIVDNTFRDPKTRGCGTGDVAAMLKTGNLGGKCADLNALFVGLARASGVPARDLYGIRVAPSKFGYRALGANSEAITKAQHCRAEAYLEGHGWVPMDPADVRKVVLEEPPGNLPLADPKVAAARRTLFGAWETNWIAYNQAHDLVLPGSHGPTVAFLMYPQGETAAGRFDCLDADTFKYTITAKELAA